MVILAWTLVGFLSGSLPYSLIVGRLAKRVDIRQVGDHNPGAANVVRAAGWGWGALALLFDYLKGAIPVGLAWFGGWVDGWGLVPVTLAPVFGHAFSPWLGGRGGKAVATTFGIWSGLTLGAAPTIFGLLLGVFFATLQSSAWAVMGGMLTFGIFVFTVYRGPHPEFLTVWLVNLLLLAYKHRAELHPPILLRSYLLRLVRRP